MRMATRSGRPLRRMFATCALGSAMFAGACAFAAHAPLPDGMSEAEATWLWGHYTVPGTITRDGSPYWYRYAHTDAAKINHPAWTEVAKGHIRAGAKAPAALILHGCSGIDPGPTAYRLFFLERGYAIFEPDSFARPGREPCNWSRRHETMARRAEEVAFAREKIRDLPWVDQDRVVLMGLSEGGAAVASWKQPGFVAHIVAADDCGGKRPGAPEDTPVLAIVGEKDPYFMSSSCNVARDIKGSKSIVIPGAPHGVTGLPETGKALEEFLSSL